MKPINRFALLGALLAVGAAHGAATDPVGYVSLGNTTAPAIPANTDFTFALPLERPTEFAGLVASVNTGTGEVTLQGTPGLTNLTTVPYVAKLGSGAKEGMICLVFSNTASSVTLVPQPGENLTGIVAGDQIVIQKAWTPKTISDSNVIPVSTQLLGYSGLATGQNIATDITYEFDGTSWLDLGSFQPADNAVIYPGEGLVIRTVAGAVNSFVLSGEVSTTKSRLLISNPVAAGQDNVIGYNAPVGDILNVSGLGYNVGDQILLLDDIESTGVRVGPGQNKASVRTLEYQGGGVWLDLGSFQNVQTTFQLPAGEGFIYRTAAGSPLGDTVWSDMPTYVPTL